jgi:hypothetical protein
MGATPLDDPLAILPARDSLPKLEPDQDKIRLKILTTSARLSHMSRQRSVRRLYKGGYRLLISLMVLWLGVFYPALCEYHGLLLFRAPATHTSAAQAPAPAPPDAPAHAAYVGHQQHGVTSHSTQANDRPAPISPMPRHQRALVESSLISLFSLVLPASSALLFFPTAQWQLTPELSLIHQADLAPPDQPPRRFPL